MPTEDDTPSKGLSRKSTSNLRRIRKRETDRIAQRANRERTKQRILRLEEELRRLNSQDQNAVLQELTKSIENYRERCQKLEGSLLKVLSFVRAACEPYQVLAEYSSPIEPPTRERAEPSQCEHGTAGSSSLEAAEPCRDPFDVVMGLTRNDGSTGILTNTVAEMLCENPTYPFDYDTIGTAMYRGQSPLLWDPFQNSSVLTLATDEEKWDVSNDAFTRALQAASASLHPDQVDPYVPFKAISGGWHTVGHGEREKPLWNMLRVIDERVFGLWTSKTQKIALMYVTHKLVKVGSGASLA